MTNNNQLHVCFERIIPPEYAHIARQKAIAENPANASGFEAVAARSKLWRPGRTLRVAFLDGDPAVQAKVAYYAQQWSNYANITFAFSSSPDAEVRISFLPQGSWSAIGTDALVENYYPPHQPTMNYGWLTPNSSDTTYSSTVLHEFGHALGLLHEHQHPNHPIQWNEPIVLAALAGPPNYWNEETTRFNFFERYERSRSQFTTFDPKSIMLYAIPKEWTRDGLTFPTNITLSPTDKTFISTCYFS